ncbi:MAG TPA: hypothetical protein VIM65_18825 [Cyclobacteriaceae bacterium]
MKRIFILVAVTCLLSILSCVQREISDVEETSIYHNVFDSLFEERYFNFCLKSDELVDSFNIGEIDSLRFVKKLQQLKLNRLKEVNKCVVHYSTEFRRNLDYIRLIPKELLLNSSFFKDNFELEQLEGVLDSLRSPANLPINDIESTYAKIDKINNDGQRGAENGIGTISFSRLSLNDSNTKAILYYEFVCGPGCGDGAILFISKDVTRWKIVKRIMLWNI